MNPNFMKTLWKGWKSIDWPNILVTNNVFKYPLEIQQALEELWKKKYDEEISAGKQIRDSDIYRVETMEFDDEKCSIALGLMKWSELFMMKHAPELGEQLDEKNYPNGIACSCLIETKDKKFIFGIRSNIYATRKGGEVAMIGGILSTTHKVKDARNMYHHMIRELEEETGIREENVAISKLVGIQRMQNGGIAFIYYVKLILASEQCDILFSRRKDQELESLQYISRNEVIGFLRDLCFENGVLKRTMGLNIDYLEEIFRNT